MRLSFPEAVIGDLFMNYVKRIEEGGGGEMWMEVRELFGKKECVF